VGVDEGKDPLHQSPALDVGRKHGPLIESRGQDGRDQVERSGGDPCRLRRSERVELGGDALQQRRHQRSGTRLPGQGTPVTRASFSGGSGSIARGTASESLSYLPDIGRKSTAKCFRWTCSQ
jgi:hypothetical protein